ncbi:MAG: hypothetical protein RIE73_13000 [Coleofasciculus sp. C1-SOL-03]
MLILHGLGRTGEPTELIKQYGIDRVKTLWDAIPREMVEWVRSLAGGKHKLLSPLSMGILIDVGLIADQQTHKW